MRLLLAALLALPGPVRAQTIRLAVEAPALGAPGFAAPVPLALSPAPSAPGLVLPSASLSLAVLPAPAIQAAPVVAAARAVPSALAVPAAADRPAEAQKADADQLFEGAAALGPVAAPSPWLEKAKVVAAYGGLTAAAVALNAPLDHLGPMIVGGVMSPLLSAMGLFYYGASQSAVSGAPLGGESARPSGETMGMIARLAAEAKVPPPARVKILPGEGVQAQVGARDDAGYEIRVTKAFESLRPELREGILRHEFAHERHHDMAWTVATIFLAPLPVMLGLMGLDGAGALEGLLFGAIAAASILLFPASLRRSEYLADQYAASKPEGAAPLARFFIEDSENPGRAASALSGRAFASETGLKRRAILAWDILKRTFSAHPSHDRRIARLARLAAKR